MLIQTTIKKEETISREVALPYFCKKDNEFYMLDENELFTRITIGRSIQSGEIYMGGIFTTDFTEWEKSKIAEATECDGAEVAEVAALVRDYQRASLVKLAELEPVTHE
jgi:hypothetical protein